MSTHYVALYIGKVYWLHLIIVSGCSCPLLLGHHREARHQQEQRADQLKKLMQKDALIKLALSGYMMGRCTYSQVRPSLVVAYTIAPLCVTMHCLKVSNHAFTV